MACAHWRGWCAPQVVVIFEGGIPKDLSTKLSSKENRALSSSVTAMSMAQALGVELAIVFNVSGRTTRIMHQKTRILPESAKLLLSESTEQRISALSFVAPGRAAEDPDAPIPNQ